MKLKRQADHYDKLLKTLEGKPERSEGENRLLAEAKESKTHYLPVEGSSFSGAGSQEGKDFPAVSALTPYYYQELKTIDELLERDKKREEDGFPRKVRLGRIIKPGKGGTDKIVIVPTTVEEKFYHDEIRFRSQDSPQDGIEGEEGEVMGGTGDGEEGDVLGEVPVHHDDQGQGGAGEGQGEGHDVASNAYDLGKILTERFKLPNLKEKGKKRSFTRYTYDLTDKNRGFGQFLDKKATLKRIIRTNRALGRIPDVTHIDSTGFLIDPKDKVFRTLSREKDYESQALVFFVRDYSASMYGKPTEIVTSQHLMIFSWLAFQYENQVETRFILHDNTAREVPDFHTYYNLSIAGGTFIASAYKLVNEIVAKDNLERDYNIYVFHGTDGDDMDGNGEEAIVELKTMLKYTNRIGVTVVNGGSYNRGKSAVESYLENSQLLETHASLIHMSVIQDTADEQAIIEGIRELIAEE